MFELCGRYINKNRGNVYCDNIQVGLRLEIIFFIFIIDCQFQILGIQGENSRTASQLHCNFGIFCDILNKIYPTSSIEIGYILVINNKSITKIQVSYICFLYRSAS